MGYKWKKIEQNVADPADNISRLDWTGLGLSVEHALECKYKFWNYRFVPRSTMSHFREESARSISGINEIIICSHKNDHFRPIILAFSSTV